MDNNRLVTVDPRIEAMKICKLRGERLWPEAKRHCVKESFTEAEAEAEGAVKEWTFYYSDDTTEVVTVRVKK